MAKELTAVGGGPPGRFAILAPSGWAFGRLPIWSRAAILPAPLDSGPRFCVAVTRRGKRAHRRTAERPGRCLMQDLEASPGKTPMRAIARPAALSATASVLLLLIVVAGAALRLRHLAVRDFWVDEALSVILAGLPWRQFLHSLWHFQANMSFYYLLVRGWVQLGDDEAMVRGLSVLFGVAAIPAIYMLGRHLFGGKAALASALLSAVNVFQIRFSQEARGYSLLMLLAVLSTYFFVRALQSPTRSRYWVGYVLASGLGIYVHLFCYLVLAAQWLSLGSVRLRRIPAKPLLLSALGLFLLTAPMNAFVLVGDGGQLSWVPRPSASQIFEFASFFTGNGGAVLAGIYAVVCFVALWSPSVPGAPSSSSEDEVWFERLVASWLLFPILSTLLVSVVVPLFYDRFMAVSVPALALLAGAGLSKIDRVSLRRWSLFPIGLAMLAGLSIWGIHRYDRSPVSQGDHWREAVHYLLAAQQPGDAVIFYRSSGAWPFEYYAKREIKTLGTAYRPLVLFPTDAVNPQQTLDQSAARLAVRGQRRVWLVLQHDESVFERRAVAEAIQGALQGSYRISQYQTFSGRTGPIRVLLYVRNPASAEAP
jgi:mannosyltransferase